MTKTNNRSPQNERNVTFLPKFSELDLNEMYWYRVSRIHLSSQVLNKYRGLPIADNNSFKFQELVNLAGVRP